MCQSLFLTSEIKQWVKWRPQSLGDDNLGKGGGAWPWIWRQGVTFTKEENQSRRSRQRRSGCAIRWHGQGRPPDEANVLGMRVFEVKSVPTNRTVSAKVLRQQRFGRWEEGGGGQCGCSGARERWVLGDEVRKLVRRAYYSGSHQPWRELWIWFRASWKSPSKVLCRFWAERDILEVPEDPLWQLCGE